MGRHKSTLITFVQTEFGQKFAKIMASSWVQTAKKHHLSSKKDNPLSLTSDLPFGIKSGLFFFCPKAQLSDHSLVLASMPSHCIIYEHSENNLI